MALRVLLADESSTIKKVIQLALQDFAVEVKAVPSGLDVMSVARSFNPDIVFADVLLPKRSGYEVAAELKRDPTLATKPVVLMWSSFMDFDEQAFEQSLADTKIEKPFEVEDLRKIVRGLVLSTQDHPVADFLDFPTKLIEPLKVEEARKEQAQSSANEASASKDLATEPPLAIATQPVEPTPSEGARRLNELEPPSNESASSSSGPARSEALPDSLPEPLPEIQLESESGSSKWNMDSFEDVSQFAKVNTEGFEISKLKPVSPESVRASAPPSPNIHRNEDPDETWSQQPLSQLRSASLPPPSPVEDEEIFDFTGRFQTEETETEPDIVPKVTHLELEQDPRDLTAKGPDIPQMSLKQIEEIVRAQSRDVIEALVQKIVPDLATQLIRQELERLLAEQDPRS